MGEPEQCLPPVWPSCQRVNDGKARATFTRYVKICLSHYVLFFSLESTFAQKKRKSITTHLVAKWSNTPLMLEVRESLNFLQYSFSFFLIFVTNYLIYISALQAAEFLASESPDYFWSFVKAFSEMPTDSLRHRTDKEMYELVLEVSARYLTPAQLDILR